MHATPQHMQLNDRDLMFTLSPKVSKAINERDHINKLLESQFQSPKAHFESRSKFDAKRESK
jgi:hypothetical protein